MMSMLCVLVIELEGEGHGCELVVAVPEQLRAGRVAASAGPAAESGEGFDAVAEVLWLGEALRTGEGIEHAQFGVVEQHPGGQFGHFASVCKPASLGDCPKSNSPMRNNSAANYGTGPGIPIEASFNVESVIRRAGLQWQSLIKR